MHGIYIIEMMTSLGHVKKKLFYMKKLTEYDLLISY